ncbi:SBBP repeat-containing protein [Myxococcota bacterium]|nr:SBBP repeat-containing protein [Myxococcota bacterium]
MWTRGQWGTRAQPALARRTAAAVVAVAIAVGGCGADPGAPAELETDVLLSALVVTVPGTSFLPPLAPTPTPTGPFDATLLPQLSIRLEATDTNGVTTTVATFNAGSTPAVVLMNAFQYYFVNIPAANYFTNPALAYRIRVFNGAQDLGFADVSSYIFTVLQTVPNLLFGVKVRIETRPPPVLVALTPPTGEAGGPTFTLTLSGSNFASDSIVYFDGQPLVTTFVSPTQLTAVVPGGAYPTVGNYPVYVFSPGPGGGSSGVIDWIATPPTVTGPTYCGVAVAPIAAPTGAHQWSRRFGGTQSQTALKTAADPSGNVIVTGYFYGSIDLGGGALTTSNTGLAKDQFVAKLDAAGNHLWSRQYSATLYMTPSSLAVDCAGNVYLAGWYDGVVDFGGGPLVSAGNNEIYLVKLDAFGNHVWSRRFGDAQYQWVWSLAVDAQGNVAITGGNDSTVDFGGGALTAVGGEDGYLAVFDTNGAHLWSRVIGSTGDDFLTAVGFDGQGRVLLTGHIEGPTDLGGTVVQSYSGWDAFVAVYAPSGALEWVRQFNTATQWAFFYAVSGDAAGNVVVGATFSDTHDFGAGLLTSVGQTDDFVIVKFDAAGATSWSTPIGTPDSEYVFEGLAIDAAGDITAGGSLLAKVDAAGNLLWSRAFSNLPVRGVAVDAAGNVLATGEFDGTFDFGGGPLTSAGDTDAFLVKYSP